jgi:hypothetical protein
MPYCRTRTLNWPPARVFGAALLAAPQAGFSVSQADRESGHLYLARARSLGRFPRRYAVSVTDSGLGSTVLHITWQPTSRLPWALSQGGRRATRLCRCIGQTLAAREPIADR